MTTKIKIVTEINLHHLKKKIKKKKFLRKHKMPPCCKLQTSKGLDIYMH